METSIGTLNPFSPSAFNERLGGNLVWALVYDIAPETWERIPESVTALPSDSGDIEVNEDGTMTVRYEVRQGLVWSDGEPITGEDVAFTAEAMRDMALSGVGNVPEVMGTVIATDAVDRLAYVTFAEPTLAF
jgi:peptide/nickel transport system substrate-binding protein